MDWFIAKKILSRFFFPFPLCIEILLVGLFLLWFTRQQKIGRIVVTVGTVILLSLGYDAVSDSLLRGLEWSYRPLDRQAVSALQVRAPDAPLNWVVVLGGGHATDPNIPLSSQPDHSTMARLLEGIHLYRANPGSKLILSGGPLNNEISNAEVMSRVAETIGVPQGDMFLEDQSRDTEDEARLIKPLVDEDVFILVTSASHMPRSVRLFERLGMHPIPAPTDYMVTETNTPMPERFFPSPSGLVKATRAVYEYLGLAWLKLRGVI
jgi:uncharacterized SAM-binding protein YcdF (DUF218 family)